MDENSSLLGQKDSHVSWRDKIESFIEGKNLFNEKSVLVLSVTCLILFTATERVVFKMAVDRMAPFRLIILVAILSFSTLLYSIIVFVKRMLTSAIVPQMHKFSHTKIIYMALFECICFSGMVLSSAGVTPTMTVLLLHACTTATVLGSPYFFPQRTYSTSQIRGMWIITLSLLVAFLRPLLHLYFYHQHHSHAALQDSMEMTGSRHHSHHVSKVGGAEGLGQGANQKTSLAPSVVCTVIYIACSLLQGLCNLYKEYCIISWSPEPMDIHLISSWLLFYQWLFVILASPVLYYLQGISSSHWDQDYAFAAMPLNVYDGLECVVLGIDPTPHDAANYYDQQPCYCKQGLLLIFLCVIANVIMLECLDRVLHLRSHMLDRCMACAVLVAFLSLGFYDTKSDISYFGLYNTSIGYADIISLGLLLCGMEIHGWHPEADDDAVSHLSLTEVRLHMGLQDNAPAFHNMRLNSELGNVSMVDLKLDDDKVDKETCPDEGTYKSLDRSGRPSANRAVTWS